MNWRRLAEVGLAVASGSIISVLSVIFFFGMENTTTFHPANNYGEENTWYHLLFNDEINFNGDYSIFALGGYPQNENINIKGITTRWGNPNDGRSVKLYDEFHPDSPLPEGMKVYLFWGKNCPDWKPYGVITVPANTNVIRVPRLNKPSDNYEVFNNFQKTKDGERVLNGHVYGIRWSIP